ncbi:MAG TPA: hypothetical protein VNS08_00780 [Ureibacillus sp.]|nr:hypothetical protein [Ureibacillus sp.]
MRVRFIRIIAFIVFVIILGVGYNFFTVNFSGEGKATPEEALPDDAEYEWIVGLVADKEHHYFYLSNGNYIGTEVVTKNFKGWSSEQGAYASLPKSLEDNQIATAISDEKILFGLLKPNGKVEVTVNNQPTKRISLTSLPKEVVELYQVQGYEIWYIELTNLDQAKHYSIKVLNEHNTVIDELSI